MNDEIERRLRRMSPRGAPPELRPRILAAVAAELGDPAPPSSRRRFRPALAASFAVIFGLALNYWANVDIDRRLAMVLGPRVVSRQAAEIAADVASVTDPATGQWAYDRLVASPAWG